MSTNTPVQHIDRELDLSNTGRGVWIVKVPKYIANKWNKVQDNIEVGKLKISKAPGQRAQVQLSLSEDVLCITDAGGENIPKEHRLDVSNVTRQSLGVFSQGIPAYNAEIVPESEKLYMEGRIVQKLECRPYADTAYYKLKSESIRKASIPQRQVQQLDKIVQSFKPVSNNKYNIDYLKKKKVEGKKVRDNKDVVMNTLFGAFEQHQYYNIKDLQKITRQPMDYLREILKEVCNYNLRNPHKYMWELKPEFRHYKRDGKTKGNKSTSESD